MSQISTDIDTCTGRAAPASPGVSRLLFDTVVARLRKVSLLRHLKRKLVQFEHGPEEAIYRNSEVAQKNLVATWKQLQAAGVILPLEQVGFSRFSEFEEDGHLLYLLTLAGSGSRTVVEISSQDGRICMATNLLVHHRWRGFLFDGDPVFVAEGRRFFGRHPATRALPPVVQSEWFTRANVNGVMASAGVPNEVDVLSLDIDGNDLHLWNAMTLRPRILICEFNNVIPSELALTIPYQADFNYAALPPDQALFRSASLAGYVAVCRRKGYRLVGINALGFNAIFLRDDVLTAEMPEIPVSALDTNPHVEEFRAAWWPRLAHLPWIEVPADGIL
ncbi:MAG: hypothetical protein KGL35_32625 [Bradyrhizobium sp.]|nr:hypothetical protein [Bradyrhizobium sp.]